MIADKSSSGLACKIYLKRRNHFTLKKQALVYRMEPAVANCVTRSDKEAAKRSLRLGDWSGLVAHPFTMRISQLIVIEPQQVPSPVSHPRSLWSYPNFHLQPVFHLG